MGQMLMTFSHPLARASKVWTARTHDGGEQRVLVIVTTIPLEPHDKGYKKSLVERLSRAAQRLSGRLERSRFVPAHEPLEGLERRQGLRSAVSRLRHIRRRSRPLAPKRALLIKIDCDRLRRDSRVRGQRSSRRCAAGIRDGRHDQRIGIRTRARRGHRAAEGQMGLDRRPRRGLPRRWRDRSWQRRHGDGGDGLRRRNHDDHRGRFRGHPLVPDQDLGALYLLASCSAFFTSSPGSRRSTIRC